MAVGSLVGYLGLEGGEGYGGGFTGRGRYWAGSRFILVGYKGNHIVERSWFHS